MMKKQYVYSQEQDEINDKNNMFIRMDKKKQKDKNQKDDSYEQEKIQ